MTEGKGGCCIARRGGGHVAEYNSSSTKMDMIMLKFRPIAPKPVDGTTASTAVDGGCSSVSRHVKAGGSGRGRRKNKNNNNNNSSSNSNSNSGSSKRCNNNNNNNSYNNNGGRKRKSSSPDQDQNEKSHHHDEDEMMMMISDDQKTDLTLLPLFPEAPDLSPNNSYYYNNNNNNNNQMEEDINIQLPMFSLKVEGNYKECHHHQHQHSWW